MPGQSRVVRVVVAGMRPASRTERRGPNRRTSVSRAERVQGKGPWAGVRGPAAPGLKRSFWPNPQSNQHRPLWQIQLHQGGRTFAKSWEWMGYLIGAHPRTD